MLSANRPEANFRAMRRRNATHPIEQVGEQVRAIMPWSRRMPWWTARATNNVVTIPIALRRTWRRNIR
jgi:hypothetical protein